jgi:hypothetical protein
VGVGETMCTSTSLDLQKRVVALLARKDRRVWPEFQVRPLWLGIGDRVPCDLTGLAAPFADGGWQFADSYVRGQWHSPRLTVGGQKGYLEAAMGTKGNRAERQNPKLLGAAWAAGIGIMLVEMHFGMDYVLSHVAAHIDFVLNWLPAISVLARHIWM